MKTLLSVGAAIPRLLALAIAITAAVVTQPASAITHQLVITENSSTSLSATIDGNSLEVEGHIESLGPNKWLIEDDFVMFNVPIQSFSWVELENSSLGNAVSFGEDEFGFPVINAAFIVSDVSTNFTPKANGATVNNVGLYEVSIFLSEPLSATFIDNSDVAAAPDAGSTFGLLFLSLIALLGASRLRSLRLA
jgi:hypothetical protein